ncbi:MAG TPA: excinuclease ABC subunit B, partial [Synechococcus sp. UBA8638]|nr:excinuclease ABC subunit B [Synechococcus sp. UBA8638]
HSIERIELIQDLRTGAYDVLVGVNLLREGLDLPEVSLVAILDADKEGFLRSDRSLIQTIGRAARHVRGTAILYGDRLTNSMDKAIDETKGRRQVQQEYNSKHGITPRAVATKTKGNPILADLELSRRLSQSQLETATVQAENDDMPLAALPELIGRLEDQMKAYAKDLNFEEAAKLRDRIRILRQKLVGSS